MKKLGFILVCITIIATSCKRTVSEGGTPGTTASSGKYSQVVLIMDTTWNQAVKDSICAFFQQPQPGLPQREDMFDVQLLHSNLFSEDISKRHDIVQLDINPQCEEPTCKIEANKWSQPQIYVHIQGKTPEDCYNCLKDNEVSIITSLYENTIAKLQLDQSSSPDTEMQEKIKNKFGILLTIPQGPMGKYEVCREGEDYLWIGYRTKTNDRFVMIYRSRDTVLTREAMIKKRNNFGQYIEGPMPGDYVQTAETESSPTYAQKSIWMNKGAELRGRWETVKDYMGGPFYQFSFVNMYGDCITIDGFVYAPKELQRDYLRQVEAIVKSIK